MTGHVVSEYRGNREWWWFFTQPLVYSVYWQQDGSKTKREFLLEQIEKIRLFREGNA